MTKSLRLEGGRIEKKSAGGMAQGTARRLTLRGAPFEKLQQLSEALRDLSDNEAIICAPPPSGSDTWPIVTKSELDEHPGAIARTEDFFPPVNGPALFAMDFDTGEFSPDLKQRLAKIGGLTKALELASPAFTSAACLIRPSASSGVVVEGSVAEPTQTGQHRFFIANDGSGVQAFVEILAQRLMLEGLLWGKITASGKILPRTIFDVEASKASSRLFYEAGAVLGEGLAYAPDARRPQLSPGGMLDVYSLEPLTEEELAKLDRMTAAMEARLAPEAAEAKARHGQKLFEAKVARGIDPETARRQVNQLIDRQELGGDAEIVLDDGSVVTAREILASPKEFHRKTCADPLEPDYGGGRNMAIIYTDASPIRIRSLAHGGIDYSLAPSPEDYFEPISAEASLSTSPAASDGKGPAGPALLPLVTLSDAAASWSEQSTKPLVKGLLDQSALSVLYGPSNVGKTFVAMDIGFCVAAGMPWGGMRTTQGVVLYVAAEGGAGARKRAAALLRRYPETSANVDFHLHLSSLDLLRPDADLQPLIATIKALDRPLVLLVVDTLSRVMAGGEENGSTDMGAMVKHFDQIRKATGAHVLVVHHSGKDQARGARGHSLLRAATDTEIEITDGQIEVTKQRDVDKSYRTAFMLVPVELGVDAEGDAVTSCTIELLARHEVPVGTATPTEQIVLDALTELAPAGLSSGKGIRQSAIADHMNAQGHEMRAETVRTHLKNLEKKRLVERPASGFWRPKRRNSPSSAFSEILPEEASPKGSAEDGGRALGTNVFE
ncbi:AAA family ATPase [Arsenicitalea aurantiaca]|nr:AAA family ATPase [Arsenicitalea aurantiaca]